MCAVSTGPTLILIWSRLSLARLSPFHNRERASAACHSNSTTGLVRLWDYSILLHRLPYEGSRQSGSRFIIHRLEDGSIARLTLTATISHGPYLSCISLLELWTLWTA